VGLLTAPITLVRAPVRLTLRVWEFGLSTAAEAARIGTELLDPDRGSPPPDFARRGPAPDPDGGAPDVEVGSAAEPEVVVPETGYLAPEPGEVGPEPDVLDVAAEAAAAAGAAATADTPPAVPEEVVPDHVDEEPVLVAEAAEEGAEEGAGAELTVDPPWDGYDQMAAADIRDRLAAATPAQAAAVQLYESTRKSRRSVLDAADRALKR
jgi:hypothetical protein